MTATGGSTVRDTRASARYGSSDTAKRSTGTSGKILAVATVLLVGLIVIMLGRYVMHKQSQTVSAVLVSHEQIDDTTSRVWFDVERKDVTAPAYCIITSLNFDMTEIGRRDVVIAPGGETQTRLHVDIPVTEPPVNGGVYGCSTTFPAFLDPDSSFTQAR